MRAHGVILGLGFAGFVACSSGNSTFNGSLDGGTKADVTKGGGHDASGDTSMMMLKGKDTGTGHEGGGCASATYQGQSAPAAMIFVLDASGTMAMNNKYADAEQAIVNAMNQPVFDTMSLGLLLYPQVQTVPAMCPALAGIGVNCAVSGLPQVPLALAGSAPSSASSGVRHDIYATLVASTPASAPGNGNPSYDALQSAITTLQSLSLNGRRLLFFITDGGASCTSQDTPQRPNYLDGNGCEDWEDPNNIVTMLSKAHSDPSTPINSLIVGVNGADTTASSGPDNPPYSVRLALSSYALAGSPETVPTGCEGTYTQAGGDPATPCHFDLTTTPNFAPTLATDIGIIRNKLLGCTFQLPTTDAGTVNLNEVNVDYSLNGGANVDLERRASTTDMCTTDGCWDYTNNNTQIELIGKACSDVQSSTAAKVEIVVGCQTLIK